VPSTPRNVGIGLAAVLAVAAPLIASFEGSRHLPYRDSVGVLTVCWGHTGSVESRAYSDDECKALLDADMREADKAVRACIPVPMLVHVEAALVSLVFNTGPRAVCGSTIQRKAMANDWPGACAAIDAWRFAGGREMRGLVLRRADERKLCEG
jgi:lysozyme